MSGSDLPGSSLSGAEVSARASGLHFVTSSAQRLPQGPLVAGAYSLYRQLKAQGYEVYRPHSLIEAHHDLSILMNSYIQNHEYSNFYSIQQLNFDSLKASE